MQDETQIDAAMEKMNTAWQAASQDIYAANQDADSAQSADPQSKDPDDGKEEVTDVEFEEVDDK